MEPTLHCARPGDGCEARFSDRVLACRICYRLCVAGARRHRRLRHAARRRRSACGTGGVFVKRLIGLPGDTWAERDGYVYIDGQRLDEPYVKPDRRDAETHRARTIPPGRYFFMGDNRRDLVRLAPVGDGPALRPDREGRRRLLAAEPHLAPLTPQFRAHAADFPGACPRAAPHVSRASGLPLRPGLGAREQPRRARRRGRPRLRRRVRRQLRDDGRLTLAHDPVPWSRGDRRRGVPARPRPGPARAQRQEPRRARPDAARDRAARARRAASSSSTSSCSAPAPTRWRRIQRRGFRVAHRLSEREPHLAALRRRPDRDRRLARRVRLAVAARRARPRADRRRQARASTSRPSSTAASPCSRSRRAGTRCSRGASPASAPTSRFTFARGAPDDQGRDLRHGRRPRRRRQVALQRAQRRAPARRCRPDLVAGAPHGLQGHPDPREAAHPHRAQGPRPRALGARLADQAGRDAADHRVVLDARRREDRDAAAALAPLPDRRLLELDPRAPST